MKKIVQIAKQSDDYLVRNGIGGGGKTQCVTTYSNTAGIGKFFVDVVLEYEEDSSCWPLQEYDKDSICTEQFVHVDSNRKTESTQRNRIYDGI